MAKKSSAKNSITQLADDVLFGARVLYRELDDIFGYVSGRLPGEAKREGLLFTRMRIAPKPLDPDEVMQIVFSCRRVGASSMYRARLSSIRKSTRHARKFAAWFTPIRPMSSSYRQRTENWRRSIHHPFRFAAGCQSWAAN